MAGIGSVVIQFLAENKMGKTLSDVKKGLSGVDTESGKARSSFGKLSASWAAALPIAGAVIGAGIGIANGLIEASKAALEDKQSADKLAKTLEKIPGVTDKMITANEDWISSMQIATLVSDTDLRDAVQKLALATGDLTKAQELTTIAVDTATASGKNLSSVTDAMAKAANGNTGALKRMFPWLDANKDGTLTYAEAVSGLTGKFKDSAKEASKTKPWERIGVIWDELKESVGGALLPILEELGEWFAKPETQKDIKDLLGIVEDLAREFGEDLLKAVKDFLKWLKDPANQKKIKDWLDDFKGFARAVGEVVSAIKDVIYFMGKIPKPPNFLKFFNSIGNGLGSVVNGNSAAAATTATRTSTTATPQPAPVVMVTEEQIARAVQRILMRSDARNGRITRIA